MGACQPAEHTLLQHHIHLDTHHLAGNDGLGRTVFLPGSAARAAQIAQHFDQVQLVDNPRGIQTYLGTLHRDGRTLDVAASCSGMGPGSAEIVVHELIAAGARRIVRVGSCGAMDRAIQAGQVCILSGAVRDESTTQHVAPLAVPAVSRGRPRRRLAGVAAHRGLRHRRSHHTRAGSGQRRGGRVAARRRAARIRCRGGCPLVMT